MDEFLVGGESIIRSLLVGQRIAADFGACMPVGYLADQFGNISQMPQIFRGFGIDNCIFGRGLQLTPDRSIEFDWESPDGSSVTCSLMAWWYNNAQRVPDEPAAAAAYFSQLADLMGPRSRCGHLLLMNGVDHLDVQENVGAILSSLAGLLDGIEVRHSTLTEYVRSIQASTPTLWVHRGEMREDRGGSVLAGVLSTRLYLKQANSESETALERIAEPMAAFSFLHGHHYDRDLFSYAWKRLMWNHPHDSICGCSVDQVHREMMPRFSEVTQVAEELASRAAHSLADLVDAEGPALVVFNTLGFERTDLVETTVDFPLGPPTREGRRPSDVTLPSTFLLLDQEGSEVCYQVSDVETTAITVLSPVELPLVQWIKRFKIKFVADDVPPLGFRTYQVDTTKRPSPPNVSLTPYPGALENELLLLEIMADGSLHILEKSTERDYEGCNAFQDGGDSGDEYYYRAPLRDEVVCTARGSAARISLVESGPAVASYRVEVDLDLPAALTPDQRGRSQERKTTRIVSLVSLAAGSNRVEISTIIDNQSKDHRLRALFPTGIASRTAAAEGQFDVLTRPARPPADWQGAASTNPQQSFVDVSDGADGLCILNRGLTEYELLDDQDSTIALTLVRSIGLLSSTGDGPAIKTPDAQCHGTNIAEYAIFPHAGSWLEARAWQEGHSFRTPLQCVQAGAAYQGERDTVRRQQWRSGKPDTSAQPLLPPDHSFLIVVPEEVVVSAVKVAEDRDSIVVRVYNISDDPVEAHFSPGFPCAGVWRLNLAETREEEVPLRRGSIAVPIGGKQIVTLELVPGEA
ncbi:MAG: glycosyl hydrolase-related protein [Chloroflexi bacterium]|nr:glycosyl hydrolase-related protein [Chloroflexota bacterium]